MKSVFTQKPAVLLLLLIFLGTVGNAQSLKEITGKRFFEHHSPSMKKLNGAPGPEQSGYDFVQHDYYSSFDVTSFGKYLNGEEANIDMVEHFETRRVFTITSGESSIWAGDIWGNSKTQWVVASANFDYNTVSDVADLESEFQAGAPSLTLPAINEGEVYIARIRNTDQYVAMKCYNVTNANTGQDIFFDFDYKYGTRVEVQVGIEESSIAGNLSIFPNPASDWITLDYQGEEALQVTLLSVQGQIIQELELAGGTNQSLDLGSLPSGMYVVRYSSGAEASRVLRINKK
ncbi:T9SS type A sorting domain-containing protein [bacterium SCSIO 12741]|nr:T9SS type A sorting domain-containing protein [bacterium SCSIO 12741]